MSGNIVKIETPKTLKPLQEDNNQTVVYQNLKEVDYDVLKDANIVPNWGVEGEVGVQLTGADSFLDDIYVPNAKKPDLLNLVTTRQLESAALMVRALKKEMRAEWIFYSDPEAYDTDLDLNKIHIYKNVLFYKIRIEGKTGKLYRNYDEDFKRLLQVSFFKAEEESIIWGDGMEKMTGILYRASLPVEERYIKTITSGTQGEISADDIYKIVTTLKSIYHENAVFLMNQKILNYLTSLTDKKGMHLLKDGKLAGYPMYYSDDMPLKITGKYPIIFGNFKKYLRITDIGEAIKEQKYPSPKKPGATDFVYTKAVGGDVVDTDAFIVLKIK